MRVPKSGIAFVFGVTFATVLVGNPPRAAPDSVAAADTAQAAVWTAKKLHFVFAGFTTKYSCEGLRDKMRQALLALGARKEDLRVREGACSRPFGPEPFPNVDIQMSVLEPARVSAGGTSDTHAATMAAHWKGINLVLDKDPLWQAEDCELLEQIKQRVLPLFATRNVDFHSNCVAHQVFPGGTWLRAQVLVLDRDGRLADRH
jgi:hypothetical protein